MTVAPQARGLFVYALGVELDARGGHAAGYVTDKHRATRVGYWTDARRKFQRRAAEGSVGIIHTRFATCGNGGQDEAHPFEIRRDGRVALWGAHNGMIDEAFQCAREHDRKFTVDSRELFELIADEDFERIRRLSGYGVATWMKPGDASVYIARLSDDGEICVVALEGGGFAWASTWRILSSALAVAGLKARCSYELTVGQVYRVTPTEITRTPQTGCKLGSRWGAFDWSKWGAGALSDEELDALAAEDAEDAEAEAEENPAQVDDLWEETTTDPWDDGPHGDPWADRWMNVGRTGA